MLPQINFSDNQQNMFYNVLRQHSRNSDMNQDTYYLLSFISIFHKYDMFMRMGKN